MTARTVLDSVAYALCRHDESGDTDYGNDHLAELVADQLASDGHVPPRVEEGSVGHVLISHLFAAVHLGAQLGEAPHKGYEVRTAQVIVRDLVEHGHHIVGPPATQDTLVGILRSFFLEHADRPYPTYEAMGERLGEMLVEADLVVHRRGGA